MYLQTLSHSAIAASVSSSEKRTMSHRPLHQQTEPRSATDRFPHWPRRVQQPLRANHGCKRQSIRPWPAPSSAGQADEDPTEANWTTLSALDQKQALLRAALSLSDAPSDLAESGARIRGQLQAAAFEPFLMEDPAAFVDAARGRCPLNESNTAISKRTPLFQPHRLADLAAFYRAFGLEIGERPEIERQDHLCIELEFMCVLTAKKPPPHRTFQLDLELLETCRTAQQNSFANTWAAGFRLLPGASRR